jgi:hypothetical protein
MLVIAHIVTSVTNRVIFQCDGATDSNDVALHFVMT